MASITSARGSILLYGRSGSFQSLVAFDLACHVALGGQVVVLCDDGREASQIAERATAWRYAA